MQGRLQSFRVRNFKAVQSSGLLKLTPLTTFVGNNGSGKSSIIEALQTFRRLLTMGLDPAMEVFQGMEYVVNRRANAIRRARELQKERESAGPSVPIHRIEFDLHGGFRADAREKAMRFDASLAIEADSEVSRYRIDKLEVSINGRVALHDNDAPMQRCDLSGGPIGSPLAPYVERWQFLSLDPSRMGLPSPTPRASTPRLLEPDGRNLASYMTHLANGYEAAGTEAWKRILEAMRYVLPYAASIGSTPIVEAERRSVLRMMESTGGDSPASFEIPGWMLSTGTVRVLALLAVLHHPDPPPLICIEELENGLDPRTLQMIVNEIRAAVESKRSQVILTTHSPFLLDLLPLSSIVMTQRDARGVTFTRPGKTDEVRRWAEDFAPGQLYMMGRFDSPSNT